MALAATNIERYVTVSSATQSDHLSLNPGHEYVLQCSSAGDYTLDIQVSTDGTNWADAYYDSSTQVTLASASGAGVQTVQVAGGLLYRMDVATYNSTITMRAVQT